MSYMWWFWGQGADSIGYANELDMERCDNCRRKIRKTQTPIHFQYRTLCQKCQGVRIKSIQMTPPSD